MECKLNCFGVDACFICSECERRFDMFTDHRSFEGMTLTLPVNASRAVLGKCPRVFMFLNRCSSPSKLPFIDSSFLQTTSYVTSMQLKSLVIRPFCSPLTTQKYKNKRTKPTFFGGAVLLSQKFSAIKCCRLFISGRFIYFIFFTAHSPPKVSSFQPSLRLPWQQKPLAAALRWIPLVLANMNLT